MPTPLLDPAGLDALRAALADFTTAAADDALGLAGRAALDRGDLAGAGRALRGVDGPVGTFLRLFTLGATVEETQARRAFAAAWQPVVDAGVVTASAGEVRALLDIRPYGERDGDPWWVVSDLGSDVRPGELARDHVLGVGAAGATLAQATVRAPVGRALDVGTGSGMQALHLSRHAEVVTATDVSDRALRMAATSAALSGVALDLRRGSLFEPVAGERFGQVVANPPFVVSPGDAGFAYRDSGLAGDAVSEAVVRGAARVLAPGGVAQLLANWIVPLDGDWRDRVTGWLAGTGCDSWVWQREVADPGEYVALWLRDGGLTPAAPQWGSRYDAWLDWFAAQRVAAIGMGLVTLWRTDAARPDVVLEDVPQPVEQPVGGAIAAWHERRRWLAHTSDDALLAAPLRPAADLVRTRDDLLDGGGWTTRRSVARQSHGLRWEIEIDDAVAGVVAACASGATVALAAHLLAVTTATDEGALRAGLVPVLRDLVTRGFLLPPGSSPR